MTFEKDWHDGKLTVASDATAMYIRYETAKVRYSAYLDIEEVCRPYEVDVTGLMLLMSQTEPTMGPISEYTMAVLWTLSPNKRDMVVKLDRIYLRGIKAPKNRITAGVAAVRKELNGVYWRQAESMANLATIREQIRKLNCPAGRAF